MVYTGLGNMLYVQFGSVSDFIPEPRCSKFVVGLQTRRRKMGYRRGPVGSDRKGQERRELRYELRELMNLIDDGFLLEMTKRRPPLLDEAHPFL